MGDFLNLIFPEKNICFVCGDYDKSIVQNLCAICSEKFIYINKGCSACGRKLHESTEELEYIIKCRECIKRPHYFTKSVSTLSYEGDIKHLIYKFKYSDHSHMYKLFGQLMVKSMVDNDLEYVDIVVPVPLHIDRLKKRGYNQAELLAKYIGKELDLNVDTKTLIRQTQTSAQNKLSRSERIKNIDGAFMVLDENKFKQKKILLVDDIYTTGSTVDECSKLILEHCASEVFVVTLAATPNKE